MSAPNPQPVHLIAGATVLIRVISDDFMPALRIRKPDHSVYAEIPGAFVDPDNIAEVTFIVPVSGSWSIEIFSDPVGELGSYHLDVDCDTDPVTQNFAGTATIDFDATADFHDKISFAGSANIDFTTSDYAILRHGLRGTGLITFGSSATADPGYHTVLFSGSANINFSTATFAILEHSLAGSTDIDFGSLANIFFYGSSNINFGSEADPSVIHALAGETNINFVSEADPALLLALSGFTDILFAQRISFSGSTNINFVCTSSDCPLDQLTVDSTAFTVDSTELTVDQTGIPTCGCDEFSETLTLVPEDVVLGLRMELSPPLVIVGETANFQVSANGFDIEDDVAWVLWEIQGQEPVYGTTALGAPLTPGVKAFEVEVLLLDGRRLYLSGQFTAIAYVTPELETFTNPYGPNVRVWFPFDSSPVAATGSGTFVLSGGAHVDNSSWLWASRPEGGALASNSSADAAGCTIGVSQFLGGGKTTFSLEAMICRREASPTDISIFPMFMEANWNAYVGLRQYSGSGGLYFAGYNGGGSDIILSAAATAAALTLNQWHHVKVVVNSTGYAVYIDGTLQGSLARAGVVASWAGFSNTDIRTGGVIGWCDEFLIQSQ